MVFMRWGTGLYNDAMDVLKGMLLPLAGKKLHVHLIHATPFHDNIIRGAYR